MPPNSFALARTVEYFRMPPNVLAICLGKVLMQGVGIMVIVTPIWRQGNFGGGIHLLIGELKVN